MSLLAQTLCKVRRMRSRSSWCAVLPNRTWFPDWCSSRQPLLGKFLSFLREGAPSGTPASRFCGVLHVWSLDGTRGSRWATSSVVNTITSARAPSTKTRLQAEVEPVRRLVFFPPGDPRRCPIAVVLSFLQDGLERRLSPSTLKVYVAAIAAHHDAVDGKSVGSTTWSSGSSEGRGG